MNVLLSRAKWKLILVGSLSFYRNVMETAQTLPDQDIGFIKKFLDALDVAVKANEASIVPISKLSGGTL
jgi:hypothetical protein